MKIHLFLLFLLVERCVSFGIYFLDDELCDRRLEPGAVIMNSRAERSAERRLQVSRVSPLSSEEEVFSPATCNPGDVYRVRLTDGDSVDHILQADALGAAEDGASSPVLPIGFEDGACGGRRTNREGSIVIPKSLKGPAKISLIAGWAVAHSVVSISEPFIIDCKGSAHYYVPIKKCLFHYLTAVISLVCVWKPATEVSGAAIPRSSRADGAVGESDAARKVPSRAAARNRMPQGSGGSISSRGKGASSSGAGKVAAPPAVVGDAPAAAAAAAEMEMEIDHPRVNASKDKFIKTTENNITINKRNVSPSGRGQRAEQRTRVEAPAVRVEPPQAQEGAPKTRAYSFDDIVKIYMQHHEGADRASVVPSWVFPLLLALSLAVPALALVSVLCARLARHSQGGQRQQQQAGYFAAPTHKSA